VNTTLASIEEREIFTQPNGNTIKTVKNPKPVKTKNKQRPELGFSTAS
jgi:hypothetical protein